MAFNERLVDWLLISEVSLGVWRKGGWESMVVVRDKGGVHWGKSGGGVMARWWL